MIETMQAQASPARIPIGKIAGGVALAAMPLGLLAAFALGFVPGTNAHTVRAVKTVVADMMKDPASAQFRNVRAVVEPKSGATAVCGEVNARNGFGALGGYSEFFSSPKQGQVYMISPRAFEPKLVASQIDTCKRMVASEYSDPALTVRACDDAAESATGLKAQKAIEAEYAATCG